MLKTLQQSAALTTQIFLTTMKWIHIISGLWTKFALIAKPSSGMQKEHLKVNTQLAAMKEKLNYHLSRHLLHTWKNFFSDEHQKQNFFEKTNCF